jgi:hypothetical protein
MASTHASTDASTDASADARLEEYVAHGAQGLGGGVVRPEFWAIVRSLADLQARDGVDGPVAEIGVHHGRIIIGLMLIKRSASKSLAIDLFDLQQFNLDHSGKGDLEIFRRNVEEHYGDPDAVGIVKGDSLSLGMGDLADIHREYAKFSIFSIDGGHTAEHTYHDLEIAAELTAHGGIVLVDDYYNHNFPGVQEGVCKWFFDRISRFAPLCFAGGRLFLCDIAHHKPYLDEVRRFSAPGVRVVRARRFGWETVTVAPDKRAADRRPKPLAGGV